MNRRASTRVAVQLGCHVVWPQDSGSAVMFTKDISRNGILLGWDPSKLPVPYMNEMLIVELELPELAGFERRCIRCQATVARLNPTSDAGLIWVGLRVHAMDFQVAQVSPIPVRPINGNGHIDGNGHHRGYY